MPVPPPPPPPPPPPSTFAVANTEKPSLNKSEQRGRNALLSDISKGKRLKKSITNDRSAPVLEKPRQGITSTTNKIERPTFSGGAHSAQRTLHQSNVANLKSLQLKDNGKNAPAVHEVSKTALGGHKAKVSLALPHGLSHTRSLSVPQLPLLPARQPSGLPPLTPQTSLPPPPPPHTSRPPLPRHLSVNAAQCCPLPVPKEKTRTSSRLPQWPPRPPALPSKPANTTTVCRTITHRANLPSLPPVPKEEQRRSPRPPKKSQSFGGHDRPPPVRSRPLPPLPNDRPVPGASLEATLGPPLPPNKPTLRSLPLPTSENTAVNSHNHNTEPWEDRFTFHHVTELPQPEAYVPGPKTYPSSFVKRHPKGKRGGSPLLPPVNIT